MKYDNTLENTNGEDSNLYITDTEARKCRYRQGLDTPLVYTVNYTCLYEK